MWDQFGDGWSGAALLIQTPSSTSSPQRYAPSCDQNPLDISFCADPSDPSLWGVFNFSLYAPANTPDPWEIAWRVTVTNLGDTTILGEELRARERQSGGIQRCLGSLVYLLNVGQQVFNISAMHLRLSV